MNQIFSYVTRSYVITGTKLTTFQLISKLYKWQRSNQEKVIDFNYIDPKLEEDTLSPLSNLYHTCKRKQKIVKQSGQASGQYSLQNLEHEWTPYKLNNKQVFNWQFSYLWTHGQEMSTCQRKVWELLSYFSRTTMSTTKCSHIQKYP